MGTNQINAIVAQTEEEAAKFPVIEKEIVPEKGESLVVNKVLLKQIKEVAEPTQRKTLLRSVCKFQGK